jgi:hypothetical protein
MNRKQQSYRFRALKFEQLEDRKLLSITVNTLVDENNGIGVGKISLREAIAAAAPGETIVFAPTLTSAGPASVVLTRGELLINKSLIIKGPDSGMSGNIPLLTIDASGNDSTPAQNNGDGSRIFTIDNANSSFINVAIENLTLTGGDTQGAGGGGAISNRENLVLSDTLISSNGASPPQSGGFGGHGGAIYNLDGTVVLLRSMISGNTAEYDGGGIYNRYGTIRVEQSVVSGNTSNHGRGGGIYNMFGNTSVTDSVITDNRTIGGILGQGGGIFSRDGVLTVTNSKISGNISYIGGGIANTNGQLYVESTTISGNSASGNGSGVYTWRSIVDIVSSTVSGNRGASAIYLWGWGGVSNETNVRIEYSTIFDNWADNAPGGIYALDPVSVNHSIAAGNRKQRFGEPTVADDVRGPITVSHSLIGVSRDGTVTDLGGSQIGSAANPLDPKLMPLANNGGRTFLDNSQMLTHAPQPGSPALNMGNLSATAGVNGAPLYDQRGATWVRVYGGRIDIGAVETQPRPGDYNRDGNTDAADYVLWRKVFESSTHTLADGSGDGVVDETDHGVWSESYGSSPDTVGGAGAEVAAIFAVGLSSASALAEANINLVSGLSGLSVPSHASEGRQPNASPPSVGGLFIGVEPRSQQLLHVLLRDEPHDTFVEVSATEIRSEAPSSKEEASTWQADLSNGLIDEAFGQLWTGVML